MDPGTKGAAEGQTVPLAIAVVAWLLPIVFGTLAVVSLGVQSNTRGIPDAMWFAWFGAVVGIFGAVGSLMLIYMRTRNGFPIVARSIAKNLALTLIAAGLVATYIMLASR